MKSIIVAIALALVASSASAFSVCGYPPYSPPGCKQVCVCSGNQCSWVAVCR